MTILEQQQLSPTNSTSSSGSSSSTNVNSLSPNSHVSSLLQQHQQSAAAAVAAAAATKAMLSSMADRYITPEYLAPLPPTSAEKTGKSPLQLLAQTCSQIGADTGSNKLLQEKSNGNEKSVPSSNNSSGNNNVNNNNNNKRSPALVVTDPKPFSFKPYEKDVSGGSKAPSVASLSPNGGTISPKTNGKSPSPRLNTSSGSSSSSSTAAGKNTTTAAASPKESPLSTTAASAGATTTTTASNGGRSGSNHSSESSSATTPVIRSGMEVLAGHSTHHKDTSSSFRLPSAMDPSNPAFRPPFGGAHGAFPGFPPTTMAAGLQGVCRDPYCRDPTCPTAIYNAQLTAASIAAMQGAAGLPPGYAELLQAQKMGLGLPSSLMSSPGAMPPTSSAAGASGGAYICNWMNGREGYCGKRHNSAEELLQHLRTHTNLSTTDSAAAAALMNPSLYSGGFFGGAAGGASAAAAAAAGLHRSYAAASALSSNRFHPYGGKPSAGLPPSLGMGGLGPAGMPPSALPPSLAGLGGAGAYSPASLYALYGSRLAGGSSVLP